MKKRFTVHFLRVWEERFPIEVDSASLAAAKRLARKQEAHRSTDWDDMQETLSRIQFVDGERGQELYNIDDDPKATPFVYELAALLAGHLAAWKALPSADRKNHAALLRRSARAVRQVQS